MKYRINGTDYNVDYIGEALVELGWIISYKNGIVTENSMGFDPIMEVGIIEYLATFTEDELNEIENQI